MTAAGSRRVKLGVSMNFRIATRALVLGLLLASAQTASAHHSVAGQFDMQHGIALQGVVSKVDWINPHIYVYLDVKNKEGNVDTWRLECVPVAMARKAGLTMAMLKGDGTPVTVDIYPARDGTQHLGFILKITFQDGRVYQFTADTRAKAAS